MSSRRGNNGIGSHRPLTLAKAKRLLEAVITDTIDNTSQLSQQDETPSESVPAEPPRHEVAKRLDSTTTSTNH